MIFDDPDKLRLALRRRAMDLLARREHTRYELKNKLAAGINKSKQNPVLMIASDTLPVNATGRVSDCSEELAENAGVLKQQHEKMIAGLLTEVLDKLEQDKLLSDSRFTESYINGRLRKGYGPLYIRHQLQQKQVSATHLEQSLEQLDSDTWMTQLSDVIKRRLGVADFPERGSKEYLKLQRFILSRGFTASQWREVEKRFRFP